MQIGGLGGSHSTSDHHVTNCIHDHHDAQKNPGGMAMKASAAAEASAAKSELLQEGQFSLAAWLKNTLGNGRGLLRNFWEGGQAVTGSPEGRNAAVSGTDAGQTTAGQALVHTENSGTMTAAAAVQPSAHPGTTNSNGHYSGAKGTNDQRRVIWKRVRDYFQNMSGRPNGKRSQRGLGLQAKKSSCQTGREQLREEELRRQSRYRRDTVEISVAPTEDNYLMDSYDRKGEYSRLTTKK